MVVSGRISKLRATVGTHSKHHHIHTARVRCRIVHTCSFCSAVQALHSVLDPAGGPSLLAPSSASNWVGVSRARPAARGWARRGKTRAAGSPRPSPSGGVDARHAGTKDCAASVRHTMVSSGGDAISPVVGRTCARFKRVSRFELFAFFVSSSSLSRRRQQLLRRGHFRRCGQRAAGLQGQCNVRQAFCPDRRCEVGCVPKS